MNSLITELRQSIQYPDVDLSGLVMQKYLSYKLGFPWTGDGIRSEFPAAPLDLKPLPFPGAVQTNLSLFMGTPDIAAQASTGKSLLNQFNLAHADSIPLRERYLGYLVQILGIAEVRLDSSILTGSGSAGLQAAIALAHQRPNNPGERRGVVCSTAAHNSIKGSPLLPVHRVAVDPHSGRWDALQLGEILETQRPAALIETVGTTDTGLIECISDDIAELCEKYRILRIKDCTLASLFPLYNTRPVSADDTGPDLRRQYFAAIQPGSYDVLVAGTSKHFGVAGIAAVLVSERAAAELAGAVGPEVPYFNSTAVYGTTTLGAGPLVQTTRVFELLGPWRMRYLAVNAARTARTLASMLEANGIAAEPVRINAVIVQLTDTESARQVQRILSEEHSLAVALVPGTRPGIRIVIPLDKVLAQPTLQNIGDTLVSTICSNDSRQRAQPRSTGRSTRYQVEQGNLVAVSSYYDEDQTPTPIQNARTGHAASPSVVLDPDTFDVSDRLQSSFAVVAAQTDEAVLILASAFAEFHATLLGTGSRARVHKLAQEFLRQPVCADSLDDSIITYCKQVAGQLCQISGWSLHSGRKEVLYRTLAEQVIANTDNCYNNWVKSLAPVERQDRLAGIP